MDEAQVKDDPVKIEVKTEKEKAGKEEDATAAETSAGNDPADLLALKDEEAKANYDKYLRVAAEFENYKKRTAREAEDFRKYANESLLKDLLPVVDNLERALSSMDSDAGESRTLAEGVKLTHKDIMKVLEKYGVIPVESEGAEFDPCRHQALMMDESGTHPPNTVTQELQKGYMLKDRLLRPALVKVSAGGSGREQCEAD